MEDSSVNLLSMKMHTNENNNMLETQKIDICECEKPLKPEKSVVITTRRTRVLFVIALILIGLAILSLIGAVVLVVRFSGKGQEKISSQNQTSFTTTISPKPSSSSPVQNTTSSAVPVETTTLNSTVISTTVTTKTTTATVSISTTPVSVCDSEEFLCSDGSCIAKLYVCDGKPHCPLADDEYRGCECSDKQFRCHSGQCIDAIFRCDGVTQCHDRSDEYNCSNCKGFQCQSGQCLWSMSVKCNDHVDCLDLSDETSCGWRPGYRRCNNGMWVNRLKFCNKIDDCFDNSDEEGCDTICNPVAEKMCGDQRTCILHEWSCDGFPDCPDGSDEKNCGTCKEDESQCSDYSCIPAQQVCDGIKQCAAGNDEVDCLRITSNDGALVSSGIVTVKSDDKFLPICSDVWSTKSADVICKYFGHRSSAHTMFLPQTTAGVTLAHGFMVLKDKDISLAANESLLSKFMKLPMCPAEKVVSVKCKPNGCGERKIEILTPFIVGGTISPKGKWPWMVSVSMLGQGICGGVVLNSRWILTAAHCVVTALANYTLTPHYYEITAGTILWQRTAGDQSQRRRVDKIVLHPKMRRLETGLTEWDLALFHIDFPLFYSDYLQPICLPEQDEVFPTNSQCYIAGWGYINPQEVMVNDLREGKMRLWGEEDCAKNGIDAELNTNATICAGYHSGAISSCKGDSGSPLMCADNQGHWTAVGVMSHGVNGCDGRTLMRANRYARVSTAVDWIRKTTGD